MRTLLEHGSVVVIDNLLTGHEANLQELHGQIQFHRLDIRNAEAIAPVIRRCGCRLPPGRYPFSPAVYRRSSAIP